MAIIKKKTKKAIKRDVTKLVKKHGAEIAMGLVSNLVTGITAVALASDDLKKKKKKKDADDGDKPKKKKKK